MHGGDAGGSAGHVDTGGHVAHVDTGSHFYHTPIHHDHGHHHHHDDHHHHKHQHDADFVHPPPPYYTQHVYGTMLPQHRTGRRVEVREYTYDVSPAVQAFQIVLMVAIIGFFVFLVALMATDRRFGGPGW